MLKIKNKQKIGLLRLHQSWTLCMFLHSRPNTATALHTLEGPHTWYSFSSTKNRSSNGRPGIKWSENILCSSCHSPSWKLFSTTKLFGQTRKWNAMSLSSSIPMQKSTTSSGFFLQGQEDSSCRQAFTADNNFLRNNHSPFFSLSPPPSFPFSEKPI